MRGDYYHVSHPVRDLGLLALGSFGSFGRGIAALLTGKYLKAPACALKAQKRVWKDCWIFLDPVCFRAEIMLSGSLLERVGLC